MMFGGDTFVIRAWNGKYAVVRLRGARSGSDAPGATGRELEEILFGLRHSFKNRDRAVEGPVEAWYAREVGLVPTAAARHAGRFGVGSRSLGSGFDEERVRLRIWERFEQALRSGEFHIRAVERPTFFVTLTDAPPAETLLTTKETQETYFEATVVDEVGQPIAGLEMVLTCDGHSYDVTTNGAGQVRQDGVSASRASLRVKRVQQLRDLVEPRWSAPRPGAFPQAKNLLRAELVDGLSGFPLAAKDEHLIVITPVMAPLHVEWWDGRGKHRHVECSCQVSGPRSFSGKTDKNGQLLHPDVPLGDYTLKLTVEYFKGRSYAATRTFEEKVTLTKSSGLQVLRVGPTPEVAFRRTRGYLFDTSKSFLMPRAAKHLLEGPKWWKDRAPSHLLIVGHTDVTGDQAFNDVLSQARADAVKAFLEQDVDAWLAYYDEQGPTKWGSREDRLMIRTLPDFATRLTEGGTRLTESAGGAVGDGAPGGTGETAGGDGAGNNASSSSGSTSTNGAGSPSGPNSAYGAGSHGTTPPNNGGAATNTNSSGGTPTTGTKPKPKKPETIVEWFQRTRGLEVDDVAGPKTRRALISEYMGVGTVTLRETPGYPVSVATLGEGEDYPLAETGLPLDVAASNDAGAASANGASDNGAGANGARSDAAANPLDRRAELFFFDTDFGILPPVGDVGGPEYIEWRKRVEEESDVAVDKETRHVTFLELPDVLFRTDSCVVLPEGEAPIGDVAAASGGPSKHKALTSVGLFAAAIRFCDERPNFRLFVAGHTDSVGGDSDNDKLSKERADVALALLTGDRNTFVSLVDKRHLVSDYKQILSWCCEAFDEVPFTCDPGAIDDVEGTGVEAVKTFQAEYNGQRETLGVPTAEELAVDGDVGPKTWGAFFDVMQYGIAQELGEEVADVAQLRESLQWVDDSRRALGFGEKHPIDGRGLDGYESQLNRRVEVMFFEYGHEPDLATAEQTPEACDVYLPGEYERVVLAVVSAKRWRAEWERVDEPARTGNARAMLLTAPGLPPGLPAAFTVQQFRDGIAYTVLSTAATASGAEVASCDFEEWYHPERVEFGGDLATSQPFPAATYTFEVEVGGRLVKARQPLPFSDFVDATLRFEDGAALPETDYVLRTPWGRTYGKSDDKARVRVEGLAPGGALLGVHGNPELEQKEPTESEGTPPDPPLGPTRPLRLRLLGADFQPIAEGTSFTLESEPHVVLGAIGADGALKAELPGNSNEWTLLYDDVTTPVRVMDLPSVNETAGLLRRLENLGYLKTTSEAPQQGSLDAAALRFRREHGLDDPSADGSLLDSALRSKLQEVHGC